MKSKKSITRFNMKTLVLGILVFLILSGCATSVSAQSKIATYAYIAAVPNVVQSGGTVLINVWVSPVPTINLTNNGLSIFYYGFMVNVVKPDGTTITKGPLTSDDVGSAYFNLPADQIGTWSATFTWPGDNLHNSCTSQKITWTVQQQPVPTAQDVPLPDGYWQSPVSAENREWWKINGAWVQAGYDKATSSFNPYTTAPKSAHIVWKVQTNVGGLVGGDHGATFDNVVPTGPIIMLGNVYYYANGKIQCLNLATGQTIWTVTVSGNPTLLGVPTYTPIAVQQGNVPLPAVSGVWAINANAFTLYDAFSGAVIRTTPGPVAPVGTSESLANVRVDVNDTGYVYLYVSWRSGVSVAGSGTARNPYWDYQIVKWDAMKSASAYQNNVVWQYNITVSTSGQIRTPTIVKDVCVVQATGDIYYTIALNTTTGQLLWNITTSPAIPLIWGTAGEKYFYQGCIDTSWRAWDIVTGQLVWTSPPTSYPWGDFWAYGTVYAYGNVYSGSFDGNIYCFDGNNGKILWKFYSGNATDSIFGTWPFFGNPIAADGIIYESTGEHSPNVPFTRGYRYFAVNATTGQGIWSIAGDFGGSSANQAIAEGCLVAYNSYDQCMYAFEKGRTATSVLAPNTAIPKGNTVLIQGAVTDQSPGNTGLGIPAKGTPAISDASMSPWMEYLYMQRPKPTNATGVPVHLTAIDPNGNFQDIGTTTTDINGNYGITWNPPVEGKYHITAKFEGSESYYSSESTTYFAVEKTSASAQPTSTPTTAPTSTINPTVSPTVTAAPTTPQGPGGIPASTIYAIAAAIVVIVVVAVAAVALRKRK